MAKGRQRTRQRRRQQQQQQLHAVALESLGQQIADVEAQEELKERIRRQGAGNPEGGRLW